MRSLRFLLTRRWLLFALAVAFLTYATWWMGAWQFRRLDETKASNAIIQENESRPPVPVSQLLAPGREVPSDDEWRLVSATGTYDAADTVIVRYRTNDEGQSGVDVVVPLVTADGTALLVDRGWMASSNEGTTPDDVPPPPSGTVTIQGYVRVDATGDSTEVSDSSTRAISSQQIGEAIDKRVYGGFVDLKSENPPAADPLQPNPLPGLGNGPHFFYAIQWWFFCGLAVVGFFYLAYDEWRLRQRGEESREEVMAERKRKRQAKQARKRAVRAAYERAWEADRERTRQARAAASRPAVAEQEPATQHADDGRAVTPPGSTGSP